MSLPKILLDIPLPDFLLKTLEPHCEILSWSLLDEPDSATPASVRGIYTYGHDEIGGELLERLPNLLGGSNFGVGVDHIDVRACAARGIAVGNTPGAVDGVTADMTMALILAVPRRVTEGERVLRAGEWQGWGPTWMLGHRIWGKRLGIIGMGRIGTAVAHRARAFGLSIHYHNRLRLNEETEAGLEATYWESLDQMLSRMDIISVNCPHTPATYHLLSARRLQLLQPQAFIVNTARGEVIDEDAMVRLLQEGRIAGAGLDVFEHEPAVNKKLLDMGNVVLLPHIGSATIEGRINME